LADVVVVCPSCRTEARFSDLVPFRAECEKCSADLHVCTACRFHDRYVENECREPEADPVATKDRRNLCEYFKPKGAADADPSAEARRKLEALFGGAKAVAADDPQAEAKRKLDALFKKKPE
jgi:hypothetical protein